MSTEKMRKLMMLAETMDGVCPHCHGWGEYIDPEGFDEPVHCPHCDEDDEPIRKSRLVKDMAMDMDMDWTDLNLVDVDPADLKGFPKINEAFTRKHFQMIADTLQKIEDPEIRRAQAEEYAAQFAADNPRFRRDLFMKAAGVEELEEGWDDMDRTFVAPGKTKKDKPCPSCGGLSFEYEITGHCPDCEEDEELTEERSEYRLAEIIGKDGLAELLKDLREGGIDYSGSYFQDLYFHFLDEYPDEIPVGSRTGRPEDPEDYVLDNLERYHGAEIENYMKESVNEEEDDGDVPSRRVSDEELLAKVKEKIDATLKYLSIGMEAESGNGDAKVLAIQLRRQLKELKALIESGGDALAVRAKLHLAFVKAEKLADYSYEFDDVLWELNDADNLLYLHLSGRPVAIDEAGCPCGKEGCECGPDCDCEPVEEGFTLDAIVESLLDERGQPKDYEMSDEELAAEIEDETSEFERDSIDKEIEDEELGLRFD